MATEPPDQADVLGFLTAASTHGGLERPVERRQTHISEIVLAGARAYKLKRAVRFPYLDFSTPQRRLAACQHELELNRRTAPVLYRAVRRITREHDGSLTFDGAGPLVDAVVEMNRFDDATLLDAVATRHGLDRDLLSQLASRISDFHAAAAVHRERGGAAAILKVIDINRQALAAAGLFAASELDGYDGLLQRAFAEAAPLLDARAKAGKLRHCHGDLHLGNICLVDGRPTLFDCIEFDDSLATIDVLYDLAFLLMDLWHRDYAAGANWLCNRYLDRSEESDGLPLLPLFMSLRAAVRAHVAASSAAAAAAIAGPSGHEGQLANARSFFELARALLAPVPPRLVAIGGFSGTGKSTLAAAIASAVGRPPGARVIASDRLRKAMFGVEAETRLPEHAYASRVSEQVYAEAATVAARIVTAGGAVIVESVFDRPQDRERIEQVARHAGVPFTGLWLEAPGPALLARVAARRGDPSDATADVVRAQLARDPGDLGWSRIDAAMPIGEVAAQAMRVLNR